MERPEGDVGRVEPVAVQAVDWCVWIVGTGDRSPVQQVSRLSRGVRRNVFDQAVTLALA